MDTLDSLGRRIGATEKLESIVRTMKSLSAVSIRQYEEAVETLHHYSHAVELGFSVVLPQLERVPTTVGKSSGVVVIVFGSDHGLCGRFNDQIGDFARTHISRSEDAQQPIRWLAVGARAGARLQAAGESPAETLLLPGAPSGLVATAQTILMLVDRWRAEVDLERVLVAHNRHTDLSTAIPELRQVLPVDPEWLARLSGRTWPSRRLPTYSMATERLFAALVREHLFLSIYRAGAESMASEHATRLAAMQAAERNIAETLEELDASFRRVRQEAITDELLDLVAGFEVLQTE